LLKQIARLWRKAFDVRPGEVPRTVFMSLYLLCVLFAYYILKPVSRAMFLNNFDIDKLPYLYILIAGAGGLLAYLYTKIAVQTSLKSAVTWNTAFFIGSLLAIWWLLQFDFGWMYYVFNIWVSLFSITLVSQGWLVAANVFSSREAKRLYGLLGVGAVVGAAFGGSFTALTVQYLGTRHLLLASAAMVLLAYICFWLTASREGVSLAEAKAAHAEEAKFRFRDITGSIVRYPHLQVIIGIISLTYIVDTMVDFQFNAMAKQAYSGDQLTAFLGGFYGIYLNLVTFVLQFFLTAIVVRRFGVGGMLQIMPVTISAASVFVLAAPTLISTAVTRLTEAASRYSFNRTGMELLYLPLPTQLKNRTKAFVDISVDRMSRGIAGMFLVLCTSVLALQVRQISIPIILFSVLWMFLSHRARKEYILTVRGRLEARRLDLDQLRLNVREPATLALIEQTARGGSPRQASYALSLLADLPGYPLAGLLQDLIDNPSAEVRGKVYELGRSAKAPELLERALAEIDGAQHTDSMVLKPAVAYVLSASPDADALGKRFLDHPNPLVCESALEALGSNSSKAEDLITHDWLSAAADGPDPQRRRLAALAIGVRGDQGIGALHRLLQDRDPKVAAAACRAAGLLQQRAYLDALIQHLAEPRLRGDAISALLAYGPRIAGTLGDVLEDDRTAVAIRRQIPRVFAQVHEQRSIDTLMRSIGQPDLSIRTAVIKGLNRLRDAVPRLDFGAPPVTKQIFNEARSYFQLHAALAPFKGQHDRRSATGLLASTLEERLQRTLERLFRLLGLRYPPKEIYAAYLALSNRRSQQFAAALEFLDNLLDRQLKRIMLPLIDETPHLHETGRDLFGVEPLGPEAALRELMRSGDTWLVACAMAAAAELKLNQLRSEIQQTGEHSGAEVALVARSAVAALA